MHPIRVLENSGVGKYRSRVEIVADILKVASDGALKTHIMYKCNLSYKLLQQYLAETINAGLISSKGSRKQYTTTEKGEQFLQQFKAYIRHSEEVRREVTKVNNERTLLEGFIRNESS